MEKTKRILTTYLAGAEAPESGIYAARHDCAADHQLVLKAGQKFPDCEQCGRVHYRLIRAAKYILDDEDFAQR